MALYSMVFTKFWKDPIVGQLSTNGKAVFIYLITNAEISASGIYPIALETIAFETKVPLKSVKSELANLERLGKIKFDPIKSLIWIVNSFKYHNHSTKDNKCNVCLSALKDFKYIADSNLVQDFFNRYREAFNLPEAPPKPLISPFPAVAVADAVAVAVTDTVAVTEINTLVEFFNSTCVSFKPIKLLTAKRKKQLALRLKEFPDLEWWRVVFQKMEASSFLKGNGSSSWKATFDWLIKNDTNAQKVFEGQYEKEKHAGVKQWLRQQEEKYGQK